MKQLTREERYMVAKSRDPSWFAMFENWQHGLATLQDQNTAQQAHEYWMKSLEDRLKLK
jgi:hypothetical protein